MKWYFSVTKFSSVRDSSKIKNLHLNTNSSSTKLFLKWGNNDVLSNTSQEWRCTFELADVHQCNKVDFHCCCFVCLFFTSFRFFSTATFASGINIAWGERSFAHTRFPKTSEADLQKWLHISFVCTPSVFVCTPETRWAEQHPEFVLLSSQVHTWEYLVLSGL